MIGSGTATFTDPGDYQASIIGASFNLVLTGDGEFRARITWVKTRRLRLIRGRENVPHIAFITVDPGTVLVAFPTARSPSQTWGGVELSPGDIVLLSIGECIHQRTGAKTSQWGFISLAQKDLAACGRTLTGTNFVLPGASFLRPPPAAVAYLSRIHAQACRVAETKPEIFAHREAARSLEHDLFDALVQCLTAGDAYDHAAARRRHANIMGRFEAVLATHCDRQLSLHELCAKVGVPKRSLEICCAESLGMSPGSYVRLRRLNLVRAALQRAEPATTNISELARRYGFIEPGRFAVAYRTVFGETPSTTLRHAQKIAVV